MTADAGTLENLQNNMNYDSQTQPVWQSIVEQAGDEGAAITAESDPEMSGDLPDRRPKCRPKTEFEEFCG